MKARVVVAEPNQVSEHCCNRVKVSDSGKIIDKATCNIRCCIGSAVRGLRTIFMSLRHADCLLHELCHLDGQPKKYCGEKFHLYPR